MGNRITAIDWLVENVESYYGTMLPKKIIEKAKAMEKQQILDAVNATIFDDDIDAFEYFTETYE